MARPSFTVWNRLEPRPRSLEIAGSLAACVRDPLWLLTRQWQLGEFQGEDAGSPAFARIDQRQVELDEWVRKSIIQAAILQGQPLEKQVEIEAFTPDLSLRAELGQTFESLLAAEGAGSFIDAFRTAWPLPAASELDARDADSLRFLALLQDRVLDGLAFYRAAEEAKGVPPGSPGAGDPKVKAAVDKLLTWVDDVFGGRFGLFGLFDHRDSLAWNPARLEYELEVRAAGNTPDGRIELAAHPGRNADFDWCAFDLRGTFPPPSPRAEEVKLSVFPAHVRFRGMPNARWWDFETGTTDFGAVETQKRDLAKLLVMDFMLVHGNDWFAVPISQPLGSLSWIDSLLVRDVFGDFFVIDRADAEPVTSPLERWSMFSTAVEGDDAKVAPFFVLPASPAAAVQFGPPLEEVRFLRDEMAEMVWAVERTTENGMGAPWSGHERDQATPKVPATASGPDAPPLRYLIETPVPEHWIPFVPVALDPVEGSIALERAAQLRHRPDGTSEPILPLGRILQPQPRPYHVAEEEVPRTGTSVVRLFCRSRWTDGSTHLWIARRKGPGAGEGSSGLRYDQALPSGGA